MLIVTTTEGETVDLAVIPAGGTVPECKEVCGTSDLEIGWGYVKRVEIVVLTAQVLAAAYG
jgi:hypothetical protein